MSLLDPSHASSARDQLISGCLEMKRMLAGLGDARGRVAEEVHAIRKLGKSLRGGFALFKLEKTAGAQIQAIGRMLAGSRDAVSRVSTWNKLGWDGDPATAAAILGLLEIQTSSASRRPPEPTLGWCLARVDEAVSALRDIHQDDLAKCMVSGLRKIEQRALGRAHDLDHRKPEDFHEARKALKAWIGAASYLPEGAASIPGTYTELAEALGDENDIATLTHWLERHGFSRKTTPDLQAAMAKQRRSIQKHIIRMAAKEKKRGKSATVAPAVDAVPEIVPDPQS